MKEIRKTDPEFYENIVNLTKKVSHILYFYLLDNGLLGAKHVGYNMHNYKNCKFFKPNKMPIPWDGIQIESFCLRKYPKNGAGFAKPHFDRFHNGYRILAGLLYLNTIENNGRTIFPRLNKSITPKEGSLAFFPAFYTHMHYGESSSIDKYIITMHINDYPINDDDYHYNDGREGDYSISGIKTDLSSIKKEFTIRKGKSENGNEKKSNKKGNKASN